MKTHDVCSLRYILFVSDAVLGPHSITRSGTALDPTSHHRMNIVLSGCRVESELLTNMFFFFFNFRIVQAAELQSNREHALQLLYLSLWCSPVVLC